VTWHLLTTTIKFRVLVSDAIYFGAIVGFLNKLTVTFFSLLGRMNDIHLFVLNDTAKSNCKEKGVDVEGKWMETFLVGFVDTLQP
jgi:hypothetical protein